MKVITCVEPYKFSESTLATPEPGPGEVQVRIRRIGICGTDLHAYRGRQPFFNYPRVLGHELAGEITGIGDDVSGLATGDRVVLMPYLECGTCIACRQGKTNCCSSLEVIGVHRDGGMREYVTHPASHILKSETLSMDRLAMVEFHAIGAHSIRRLHTKEGETVCVVGAGPIGMAVMQFAKVAGLRVLAMDIIKERLQFCTEHLGVDAVVDASDDPRGQLAELTGGDMPAIVIEATGNPQAMCNAFLYPSHAGRLVMVSIVKADITFNDPEFYKRELTLLGSRNATVDDFRYVMDSMDAGLLNCDPLLTHRTDFDRMIETYPTWLQPETGVIKAVVDVE